MKNPQSSVELPPRPGIRSLASRILYILQALVVPGTPSLHSTCMLHIAKPMLIITGSLPVGNDEKCLVVSKSLLGMAW